MTEYKTIIFKLGNKQYCLYLDRKEFGFVSVEQIAIQFEGTTINFEFPECFLSACVEEIDEYPDEKFRNYSLWYFCIMEEGKT